MASFTDIYKQELKGKGVLSSLGSAALKRTKERLDPRNMLFGGSGILSATGQKIFGKGYSAINRSPVGKKIAEGGELKSEALNSLLVSSQRQEAQLTIIAKNTMNSNSMARDINVMRQNIMKLVTLQGGKASRGADMFFKDKDARESAYESQFKSLTKQISPLSTKTEAKKEENPITSFFKTLFSPLSLAIAGLIAVLTGGINAILSPITLLKSALSGLTEMIFKLLGKPIPTPTPSTSMAPLATGTIGAVAAGGIAATVGATGILATEQAAELRKSVTKNSMMGAMSGDTAVAAGILDANGDKSPEEIRKEQAIEREKLKNAPWYTRYLGVGKSDYLKGQEANTPSKVSSTDDAKMNAEKYLGKGISDTEWDMLTRAVYAESSRNEKEYANVMAVILNRSRKTGKSIIEVLTEKNQFQAVTGTANNPGPSPMFSKGPDDKSKSLIMKSTESLEGISKNMDAFTAANRAAYGAGTNTKWLDKMLASGGQQIGQTVFAENMYRPAMTGSTLATASTATSDMRTSLATQTSSAPVTIATTNNVNNSQAIVANRAQVTDTSMPMAII